MTLLPKSRCIVLLLLMLLAACTRGPKEDALAVDVQARLDAVFGQPLVEIATLNRQGSAPYHPADDGARQVIVYYNAVLRFVDDYDPSDWETLSPALIAAALGATDRGIFGLGPSLHGPGSEFRAHGSLVYRETDDGWVPSDDRLHGDEHVPVSDGTAAKVASGTSGADELVQHLAKLVMQSPEGRGADREIITEEIDRAVRNINLRLQREHEGVAIAAGPQGGEYWRFLTSVTRNLPDASGIRVVATEGSVANAFLIESHQARAGVIQSDVAAAAVTGQGVFLEAGPLGHLRAVASLFPEPVHIIVRADSDIDSVADLAGRRLTLGSPQSGSRHTALRLLANTGIDVDALVRVVYHSPEEALAGLAAGEIDAVIEVASAPWQQLQSALRTTPLRLVGLTPAQAAKLGRQLPGLFPLSIPARTYAGQDAAVQTVAATALLVAHSEVADATVAAILELFFATRPDQGGVLAARISKERARSGITIPVHEGARRFFKRSADAGVPAGQSVTDGEGGR
jgi:TRAP transporter TAXI family solute receptor